MKQYALEIYLPGSSGHDVACYAESDQPFQPIHVGDVINPRCWSEHYASQLQDEHSKSEYGIILRVTGIEHFIFQSEQGVSQHKLGIFTEAVDDLSETRTSLRLSKMERLLLANQYRILAMLEPQETTYYERVQDALESGYEFAYRDLFNRIFDGLDEAGCRFVIHTLAMYDALQRSYSELQDKSDIQESEVTFPGFDGNNETEYMAYARFLADKEDKFTYLKTWDKFNSHMPMVSRYRRMLEVWRGTGERYDLSAEEIRTVLAAK